MVDREALLRTLSDDEYIRQRLSPRVGDEFYLHLADLLFAIKECAPLDAKRVLDFGSGGSPYRSLFSGDYIAADLEENPTKDLVIHPGTPLEVQAGSFDLVLSTQVLEHVLNPDRYLQECLRVLKPGGVLLLTTHGLFEDHASPNDYWRWTCYGIRLELERAGFVVERVEKLTVGPRAAIFLMERQLRRFGPGRRVRTILAPLFAMVRRLGAQRLHRYADTIMGQHSMAEESSYEGMYIAMMVIARKPIPGTAGAGK